MGEGKPGDTKTCLGRIFETLRDQLELYEQWRYEPRKSRAGLSEEEEWNICVYQTIWLNTFFLGRSRIH